MRLFRLGHSDDASQSFDDPFYSFTNTTDGWSTAGYEQQVASRSIIAIDAPLNYWMYDRKAHISEVARDFEDYLKVQKTPPVVSLKDLQSAYLDRSGMKPSPDTDRLRMYYGDGIETEERAWPRAMFSYLEREAFAPKAGFTMTYSQKFPDAFVATERTRRIPQISISSAYGMKKVRR